MKLVSILTVVVVVIIYLSKINQIVLIYFLATSFQGILVP